MIVQENKIFISNKKVYLIDIGLWILLLMKIYKIIAGIRMITTQKKISNMFITLCISLSSMWFLYFIENTSHYEIKSSLEAIITLFLIGGIGCYLLFIPEKYYNNKVVIWYANILIFVGIFDMSLDLSFLGNSNFTTYVLISSVICELFYMIVGSFIMWFGFKR